MVGRKYQHKKIEGQDRGEGMEEIGKRKREIQGEEKEQDIKGKGRREGNIEEGK